MNFNEVLHAFQNFFNTNGIPDEHYDAEKEVIIKAVQCLHAMLLKGTTPAQRNDIRCAQELKVIETCPEERSLQQLHFFIKELRLEKSVWNVFRFINFPLQNTVPRHLRWTPPKDQLKIKKRKLITSYADSLLYLLEDKEHIILPKINAIEEIENKQDEKRLQNKQLKYVIDNIHKEEFCAKHYHFIRQWMTRQTIRRDVFKIDNIQPT